MSLRDGTKKMSKSDPSDMSRINLTDDADAIAQKFRKARTDPEPLPETLRAGGPARGAQPREHLRRAGRHLAAGGAGRVRRPGLRRLQAAAGRSGGRKLAPITAEMGG
jgi:tryptophanyl-tRNA synthetase